MTRPLCLVNRPAPHSLSITLSLPSPKEPSRVIISLDLDTYSSSHHHHLYAGPTTLQVTPPPPPPRTTTIKNPSQKEQQKKKCLFPSPPVELPPKAILAPNPTPPPTFPLAVPPSTKLFSRRLYLLPHAKTIMLFRNRFVRRDCW